MKAVVMRGFGPPEVLELADLPTPVPGDKDVLVRVQASTVCFGDWTIRKGPLMVRLLHGLRRWKNFVLGVDLAGTVESVGRSVTRFTPGDEVFGSRGDQFGAHAEFAVVSEDGFLAHKPVNMSLEEAATLFVGAVCPLYFLRKARIRTGEKVLIHGASGSLGIFAVQLAKHMGAHVTGVCGPSNLELVKSLGADAVIDYTQQDFTDQAERYDIICDILGKAGFPASLRALKPDGRYLLVGFDGGLLAILSALLRGVWTNMASKVRFITGAAVPAPPDLVFLKDLVEAEKLRTVIGRSYALAEIAEAHRYAESGHKVGNVVVVIGDRSSL